MIQPGKMMEITEELNRFNYDLVALQEVKWPETGTIREDFTLHYSGTERRTDLYGTYGFMVNTRTKKV